jgi:SNF2 family DNA or RNA helicase
LVSPANQALAQAAQLDLFSAVEEPPLLPSLVVMAPSLIHNWEKELQKFAPGLKVKRHAGYRRTEHA